MLNNQEVLVFILIEAAHQDFKFTKKEKNFLVNRFGQALFDKVILIYLKMNLNERNLIVVNYVASLSKASEIKRVKDALNELYLVDGKFCRFEKSYNEFINKLLDANDSPRQNQSS